MQPLFALKTLGEVWRVCRLRERKSWEGGQLTPAGEVPLTAWTLPFRKAILPLGLRCSGLLLDMFVGLPLEEKQRCEACFFIDFWLGTHRFCVMSPLHTALTRLCMLPNRIPRSSELSSGTILKNIILCCFLGSEPSTIWAYDSSKGFRWLTESGERVRT